MAQCSPEIFFFLTHCFTSIELGMAAFSVVSTPGGFLPVCRDTQRKRAGGGEGGESPRYPGELPPDLVVSPGPQVPEGVSQPCEQAAELRARKSLSKGPRRAAKLGDHGRSPPGKGN